MFILRSLLVVFGTLAGGMGLSIFFGNLLGMNPRGGGANLLSILCCAASCVAILRLTRSMKSKPAPEEMTEAELERLGLISEETYEAKRSLTVEEFEDEGPHVFLELVDGRVLYLMGQYLYEVVYGKSAGYGKNPPTFPCSRFRVKRRKEEKWMWCYDVIPLSPCVAPEAEFPSFSSDRKEIEALGDPCDGEIVERSFDELKSFLANRKSMSAKRK